jgi:hypothetical protein
MKAAANRHQVALSAIAALLLGLSGTAALGAEAGQESLQIQKAPGASTAEQAPLPGPPGAARMEEETSVRPGQDLLGYTANELSGMTVFSSQTGKEIGKIEALVQGKDGARVSAVVSTGGFLGIGAKERVVPLESFSIQGDKVALSASKERLAGYPEYQEDRWVEVREKDRPLSEFAGFEAGHEGAPAESAPLSPEGERSKPGRMEQPMEAPKAPSGGY